MALRRHDEAMAADPVTSSPSTPDPLEQVRELEARFASAMTQLYAVGNGLAEVRQNLGGVGAPAAAPAVPSPTVAAPAASAPVAQAPPAQTGTAAAPAAAAAPQVPAPVVPAGPMPAPVPPRVRWWERPGAVSRILGAVGAVVTLIGIAMLLAIAIAAGIFGPVPRVVAGALLAGGLLAGGAYARRRWPDTVGGAALAATGLAAAYLDVLAASALYDFIPGSVALVLAALVAVGAFALARAWDSEFLAILAAAPPALLAPAVTDFDSLAMLSFVALLLVTSGVAHAGRAWGWLYLGRTLPAVTVLLIGVGVQRGDTFPTLTVALVTALGMVAVGTLERTPRLVHLPTAAAIAASTPLLVATAATEEHTLTLGAALAALLLAVAALVRQVGAARGFARSLWVAPLVTGTVLLIIAATQLTDSTLAGIVLAVAAAAYWLLSGRLQDGALFVMGMVLAAVSALTFVEAVTATTSLLERTVLEQPLTIVLGLALTVLAWLAVRTSTAVRGGRREPTLTKLAAVAAFVTGSTTVVATGTWIGSLLNESQVGFYGGHAVATALWTALAAILITVVARRSTDRGLMVRLGLGLIGVAIAKLFLFDLSALNGLFRVVAFVVTGIIVLVVGVAYSRATDEDAAQPQPQSPSHPQPPPASQPQP